jgi:hypothetical protein
MNKNNSIPLRSAKKSVRQLRSAVNRIARNTLLSSLYSNDSHDVE